MVVPGIALHVGRGRHVARNAAIAGARRGMMGVGRRIDGGRVLPARAAVALQAKRVVFDRKNRFPAVGIVTVETGDAGFATHSTEGDRGGVENFVLHLSVRIKKSRFGREGKAVVIGVADTRLDFAGEEFVPCVAGYTRFLGALPHFRRRRRFGDAGGLLSPAGMFGRHVSVALCAADTVFPPGGGVSVGRGVVVFTEVSEVTMRTHRIPVHPPAGPMPPFAGSSLFGAEDVKPIFSRWIEGQFGHLVAAVPGRNDILPQRRVAEHELRRALVRSPSGPRFGQFRPGAVPGDVIFDFVDREIAGRLKCVRIGHGIDESMGLGVMGAVPCRGDFGVTGPAVGRSRGGLFGSLVRCHGGALAAAPSEATPTESADGEQRAGDRER